MASVNAHKFVLETRGDVSVLICNHCSLPVLEIAHGLIGIQSKHASKKHENSLTMDHLRMLVVEMYRQTHPPERW